MENYKLNKKEKIILEEMIGYNTKKINTKLTLTNERIFIEKEKGLFKKKLKLIEIIYLEELKKENNKLKTKQNNNILEIETIYESITLYFEDSKDLKKFMKELEDIVSPSKIKEVLGFLNKNKKEIANVVVAVGELGIQINNTLKKK